MFQAINILQPASESSTWIAQAGTHSSLAQAAIPPDASAMMFISGPQFFIALIAGVVMAFAFQFLLTNFSIAADISAGINPFDSDADDLGKKIRRIEAKVGGGTIVIVNVALFAACFLAVKLTLIHNLQLGAITSIVIWSVYFLLLVWAGSRAVGSLVGAVGNTAVSGIQGVMATVATALSGRAASSQIVNTVEASVEAVAKELQSTLAPEQLRETLQDYVKKLQLPQPQLNNLSGQIADLLNSTNLPSAANAIADTNLVDLAKSVTPEELRSGQLSDRLAQLIGNQSGQNKEGMNLRDRALQLGISGLLTTLAQRVDLSDLDVENIGGQLNKLSQQLTDRASQAVDAVSELSSFSPLRTDIETYLLNSPFWYLQPDHLDRGFREVLHDSEADPRQVQSQLESLNRGYFTQVLTRRENIQPDQINDIADELELIRQEVLDVVRVEAEQERSRELRQQVEAYLSAAPKEVLSSDQIQQELAALLADPDASYETLGNRLLQFDRDTLMQMLLTGRQDLSQEEAEQILTALIDVRDRFLNQSEETWNQLQSQAGEFRQQVESYLRETAPAEFTPESIRQTLQTLLNVPEAGQLAVRTALGQLDRNGLEQLLNQRQDLNTDQVRQLIDRFESVRDSVIHRPQELAGQAKEQYDRLVNQISDYLRQTNLEALNPEGIQRDLSQLINDPRSGAMALRQRLTQIDRETLVKLLSQRGDLSEEQINQVITQVQETIRSVVRTPRRLATRTRDRVRDLQSDLTDYLRNTKREELNPAGIQRDLQLLLKQPKAGLEKLGDRLSHIDRDTLVALLSEREDISEEEANRIVDQVISQIDSVRQQVTQQARKAQDQVQSMVDGVFGQVRNYLNKLDQPELNYEGIQRDVRKLFDDPEAGFEALRDRLSQFDRDTLVALLSSRSDISEEQANKIVDQIESARDSVLQRAERLQTEAEKRIKALKHEAKEQLEDAQKAVAVAAWWLFGTAITSIATAAIAGILAAGGFNFSNLIS